MLSLWYVTNASECLPFPREMPLPSVTGALRFRRYRMGNFNSPSARRRDNPVVRFFRVRVIRTLPHPGRGFTQGLLAEGQTVWESSGQYGLSVLRRYEFGAPAVAAESGLPPELYAEGICRVGKSIWQLTWRERVALRWDAATMQVAEKVRFNREGWGICAVPADRGPADRGPADKRAAEKGAVVAAGEIARESTGAVDNPVDEVVTSDGSSELVRRDPVTLEPRTVVHVRCGGHRVRWLNDLAWADGLVWANVLGTTCLAGIDLDTGEVTDVVDARAAGERHTHPQSVMNGIAALGEPGEFLLTGKGWRSIRHVQLRPDRNRGQVSRLLEGPTALLWRT
jgi:glutamine cyclotransferase